MKNPLKKLVNDGGFTSIFRTIGCIGDSLSSGEFESLINNKTDWHDMYEYSWGQFMARTCGSKVYNFSKGGMSAKWYLDSFANENDFFNKDKACQAYIIALGVNDLFNVKQELGSVSDIDLNDYNNNKETFAGCYAKIIQKYKEIQPKAKFFLVTMPKETDKKHNEVAKAHRDLLLEIAKLFKYTYVIDLYEFAPVYDKKFKEKYYLLGHLNPMGYNLTAKYIMTYIDYIIRNNMKDFHQVGLIGTEWYMENLE